MKHFYVLIILLTVIASCGEPPKTYTVNCTQHYTDNAAKSLNITFNSGTKLFKRGNLAFPINDISIDSEEYNTWIRYNRYPSKPGLNKAELDINPPRTYSPASIEYVEYRREKGSRFQENSITLRGKTTNWSSKVDNVMVSKSYQYKCSLPPNFDYKYVLID
jgi:hypothetical protein